MQRDGLGYDDALAAVRAARPAARPNEGFVRQLRALELSLRSWPEVREKDEKMGKACELERRCKSLCD